MNAARFPVAVYGKAQGEAGRGRDFALLDVPPDFPSSAADELERIGRLLSWRSGAAAECCDPCFALWPLPPDAAGTGSAAGVASRAALAIRMLDAGRDDWGRPHTLRLEAAYLPPGRLDPVERRSLLQAAAWPPPTGSPADAYPNGVALTPCRDHRRLPRRLVEGLDPADLRPCFVGGEDAKADPDVFLRLATDPQPPVAAAPCREPAAKPDPPSSRIPTSTPQPAARPAAWQRAALRAWQASLQVPPAVVGAVVMLLALAILATLVAAFFPSR